MVAVVHRALSIKSLNWHVLFAGKESLAQSIGDSAKGYRGIPLAGPGTGIIETIRSDDGSICSRSPVSLIASISIVARVPDVVADGADRVGRPVAIPFLCEVIRRSRRAPKRWYHGFASLLVGCVVVGLVQRPELVFILAFDVGQDDGKPAWVSV